MSKAEDRNEKCEEHLLQNGVVSNGSLRIPEEEINPASDGGWGWLVCFCCFSTHMLTDGMFYSFGTMFVEFLEYFGKTKGETAWVMSLNTGVCLLSGPVVAVFVNRFGCRIVAIVGGLVLSGSLIASVFAPNIYFLYGSIGILAGFGYGMVYLASIVCVSQYFVKKRALATGIGVSGSGIGTFILSPITRLLIDNYAWQGALLVYGGLVLNCIVCGLIFRPFPSVTDIKVSYSNGKKETDTENRNLRKSNALKSTYTVENEDIELNYNACENEFDINLPTNIESDKNHQNIIEEDSNYRVCSTAKRMHNNSEEQSNKHEVNINNCTDSNQDITLKLTETGEETPLTSINCDRINNHSINKQKSVISNLNLQTKTLNNLFDVSIFKDASLCMFIFSSMLYTLGYYVPFVYIPDSARHAGLTDQQGAWLLSTIGISNTVGRVLFGYISDIKCINRLYMYNTALLICGIGTCLAPYCHTFITLAFYCAVFGIFSGVTISLTSVLLADIVGIDHLADALGVNNFFCGLVAFVGSPIAGWLFDITDSYDSSYISAGVAIAISGAMLFVIPCFKKNK